MQQKEVQVLIVEDDFLVREVIQESLENMGYEVVGKAVNGYQAIEMTRALQPDIVLMDVEMPDMDGIKATEQIYACCPTPIVVLTAYETPELIEKASTAGVGAYLIKPPRERELERSITIAMARFADMVELNRVNAELQARNEELQVALAQVKRLRGLLPICASCKKIRDDDGYWRQIEVYIRDHSEAEFSHALCPDCTRTLYPELHEEIDEVRQAILEALKELGWANLADIMTATQLSEVTLLDRLQTMMMDGEVKQLNVDDQTFYKLL